MSSYRSLADSEFVHAYDVVVRAGVSFESSKQVTDKLSEILEYPDAWGGADFHNTDSDFICCMPSGYGNGHYTVRKLKESIGSNFIAAVLRLLPSGISLKQSKSLSSYSTPLPLP